MEIKILGPGCINCRKVEELVRDAVLMNGNQADRLRPRRIAQPFDDPRRRQPHALWPGLFGLDQLAILGLKRQPGRHAPFAVAALVDGQNAPALMPLAEDAQNLQRAGAHG